MGSVLYCPVRFQNRIIALVSVRSRQIAAYEEHHRRTLNALCASAGVALESARQSGELKQLAVMDPLTGVLNRSRFMELFMSEAEQLSLCPGDLSIIIFNFDHLGRINDTHGPAAGDAILKTAAKLAAKGLRSTDYLARCSAETFALLLPHTGIEGAAIVADRIRSTFERGTVRGEDNADIKFTASFGVASYCTGDDFDSLSHRAENALHYSKETGRNKVASEKAGARKSERQAVFRDE